MDKFEIADIDQQHAVSGKGYLEFFSVPDVSLGLYVLEAGAVDTQTPHNEDEVYYILSGRAIIHVGGEDREVQPGSIVFVAKHVEHRFHSITDQLRTLVFFAPAHTG